MRLVIEPFEKQPPEGYVLDEFKSHSVRFSRPGHPGFGWNTALPYRPGDVLNRFEAGKMPKRHTIERVEAKQHSQITPAEWELSEYWGNGYNHKIYEWFWLFWLEEAA